MEVNQLKEALEKIQVPSAEAMVGVFTHSFFFFDKWYIEVPKIVSFE